MEEVWTWEEFIDQCDAGDGYLELLASGYGSRFPDEAQSAATKIVEGITEIDTLIEAHDGE